jgi:hypothetical protein
VRVAIDSTILFSKLMPSSAERLVGLLKNQIDHRLLW